MGIFVQDSFTGAAGTAVPTHAGEVGGWMTTAQAQAAALDYPGYAAEDTTQLNGSGYAYKAGNVDSRATLVSNVVPPQLDAYIEAVINVGNVSGPSYFPAIQFYIHGQNGPYVQIESSSVYIYPPSWWKDGPGSVSLPGVANNATMTFRMELDVTRGTTKIFVNAVLVGTWTNVTSAFSMPKNIVIDMDSYGVSGAPLLLDSFEAGTIAPPIAFWTDLTGSLAETIGA